MIGLLAHPPVKPTGGLHQTGGYQAVQITFGRPIAHFQRVFSLFNRGGEVFGRIRDDGIEEFPELEEFLWGDSFWSDGYFAETVGKVDEEVIRKYIEAQQRP